MQLFCEPGQQVLFSQRQPYQEPIVLVFFLPVLVVRISEVSYSKQQYLNEELFSSIGNIGTGHLASRVWAKAPRVSSTAWTARSSSFEGCGCVSLYLVMQKKYSAQKLGINGN